MTTSRFIAAALSGFAAGLFGLAIWQVLVLCLIWLVCIDIGEHIENKKRRETIAKILEESKRRYP